MPNIKLLIATHKDITLPKHEILFPVQVGSALKSKRFKDMQPDDSGDNISEQNPDYCELTALYWAWKNLDADYYGLCHYRRYLSFANPYNKHPYIYYKDIDDNLTSYLALDNAEAFINDTDIVLPFPEKMYISVNEQYLRSDLHNMDDMYLVQDIIEKDYPDYVEDMRSYIMNDEVFYANMFVMKKELFNEYCEWLFGILKKFDEQKTTDSERADGYLAERLLGIFFYHLKRTKDIKYKFVQRVDILSISNSPTRNKILYALLPPGTKRRARVKKLFNIY